MKIGDFGPNTDLLKISVDKLNEAIGHYEHRDTVGDVIEVIELLESMRRNSYAFMAGKEPAIEDRPRQRDRERFHLPYITCNSVFDTSGSKSVGYMEVLGGDI